MNYNYEIELYLLLEYTKGIANREFEILIVRTIGEIQD